jgi:hypothetical protein
MSIVRSRHALASCGVDVPMVVQSYINHGGVLWKVAALTLLLLLLMLLLLLLMLTLLLLMLTL